MKKIVMLCGKPLIYDLDKVEERISYYKTFEVENNTHVTNALLKFWENYKLKHYPNE